MCDRFAQDAFRKFLRGYVRFFRYLFQDIFPHSAVAPSERKIRGAEPRLAYAVRKEDQTVLRLHLKGIRGHGPVPVFRRSEFTPVDLQRFSPAQQNEFRIAHFHNAVSPPRRVSTMVNVA